MHSAFWLRSLACGSAFLGQQGMCNEHFLPIQVAHGCGDFESSVCKEQHVPVTYFLPNERDIWPFVPVL